MARFHILLNAKEAFLILNVVIQCANEYFNHFNFSQMFQKIVYHYQHWQHDNMNFKTGNQYNCLHWRSTIAKHDL